MKTYTETQGVKPFNWREALMADEPDWDDLERRSQSWVMCACGNQCSIIARRSNGMPVDGALQSLGGAFHYEILDENAWEALGVLDRIEARSAELIAQIAQA